MPYHDVAMDSSGVKPPEEGDRESPRTPLSQEPAAVTVSHPAALRPESGSAYPQGYHAERDALADEREMLADERDRLADEREALADEREALADERERLTDERERETDERELSLDELARRFGARVVTLEERTLEHLDRSRVLLAAQAQRLDRQEAEVGRARALRERRQHSTIRAMASEQWELPGPDSSDPVEQAEVLTHLARAALTAFAQTAEEIARRHDEAAASGAGRRDEHRRRAERVREAIRRAAEIMREFSG